MLDQPAALPDDLRERIRGRLLGSKVDLICQTAEDIYTNREGLEEEALDLAAGLATYAASEGFHGLGVEDRGPRMAAVLRGQEVAEEPEAKAEYAPQPEPAEPESIPAG
jgi:hypothetical protein